MTPPHNGRPADPEYRYYWMIFASEEEAHSFIEKWNLKQDFPDYRVYVHE